MEEGLLIPILFRISWSSNRITSRPKASWTAVYGLGATIREVETRTLCSAVIPD